MANEAGPRFDLTADMRALAEKSVDQAREAFDTFVTAAQHAVNAAETQAIGARTGAREIGELALGFAERNIANTFELAQKLLAAREPKEVMALHADYVSAQIANLNDQAKKLSRRVAKVSGQGGAEH
jgi:hypothetical protein